VNEFTTSFYKVWREKRFKAIVDHYSKEFFKDKNLLELGAANGDLGNMFHKLGTKVT
jgi:hypothetical protein